MTVFICLVKNLCPVGTRKLTGLFDLINLTLYAAMQMMPNNNILYSKESLVDIDEGVAPDLELLVEGGGPKNDALNSDLAACWLWRIVPRRQLEVWRQQLVAITLWLDFGPLVIDMKRSPTWVLKWL